MSLRTRLLVYLALNMGLLLGVIVIGSRLSEQVAERIRLGVESRSIRKLNRLALLESRIATDILLFPGQTDISHYHELVEAVEDELADLESIPPTPETQTALPQWRSANHGFLRLLEKLAFEKPLRSLSEARSALRKLRDQGTEQLGILKSIGDRLRDELKSEDVRIQNQTRRHWKRTVVLCFLPVFVIVALTATYTRSLARQLQAMEEAFRSLGDGNLGTRLAGQTPTLPETRSVFRSFDLLAERLQELDQLKSQFYSMAAHDLRSPLNTILLGSGVLRENGKLDPAGLRAVDAIERKARAMLGLTETLLDRFFLERGQVEALRQRVDANRVLQECVDDLTVRARARGQTISLEPLEGDPMLWCDPMMLSQVLDNLINNAIKYSHEKDTIRVTAVRAQDQSVLFQVSDHGPGLPAEDRARLFEPFRRGANANHRIEGRGLGLAICKAFVEAHGGRIWMEGDAGATLCFTLPRDPDPAVGGAYVMVRKTEDTCQP